MYPYFFVWLLYVKTPCPLCPHSLGFISFFQPDQVVFVPKPNLNQSVVTSENTNKNNRHILAFHLKNVLPKRKNPEQARFFGIKLASSKSKPNEHTCSHILFVVLPWNLYKEKSMHIICLLRNSVENTEHQPEKHTNDLSSSPNPTGDHEAYLPSVAFCWPSPAHLFPWKFTQPTSCLLACVHVSWQGRPGPFYPGNRTLIVRLPQEMEYVHRVPPCLPVAMLSSGLMGNSRGEQTGTSRFWNCLTFKHIWLHLYLSKCGLRPDLLFG